MYQHMIILILEDKGIDSVAKTNQIKEKKGTSQQERCISEMIIHRSIWFFNRLDNLDVYPNHHHSSIDH